MREAAAAPAGPLRIGVDLVQISQVANSLQRFGAAFTERLFTPGEIAYCGAEPARAPERFAARMAAKEATLKALGSPDAGVDPRGIEVQRAPSGFCTLALHGDSLRHAQAAQWSSWSVSLSHEGDYAIAMVVAIVTLAATTPAQTLAEPPPVVGK